MAHLKITKKVRVAGDAEVYFDEQKLGVVSDNIAKTFDVPEGQHKIRVKIKWMGSVEGSFILENNYTLSLSIKDNKWINYFIISYIGIILLSLKLYNTLKFKEIHVFLLALPLVLFNLYFFTLGKNKRMVLDKS
jgi:hypothetical protein